MSCKPRYIAIPPRVRMMLRSMLDVASRKTSIVTFCPDWTRGSSHPFSMARRILSSCESTSGRRSRRGSLRRGEKQVCQHAVVVKGVHLCLSLVFWFSGFFW